MEGRKEGGIGRWIKRGREQGREGERKNNKTANDSQMDRASGKSASFA